MVRMKVKVVGLDQHTMVPVVVITDYEEKGFIPIMIGVWEATAISQGLEGQKLPRPMTHDLFKNVLDALDVKIDRILIHDLRDETLLCSHMSEDQGRRVKHRCETLRRHRTGFA